MRLRRRINTVLLQWFLLFLIVAGAVWFISFPGIRRTLIDDRLLLATTVARSLDTTISSSIQTLGRLAADLPLTPAEADGPLRAFRFQSPFGDATYLLDANATRLAGAPADVVPLEASWLGHHEAVTPLLRKASGGDRATLAIIQPFRRGSGHYYLVSEMNPMHSAFNQFLRDLKPDPSLRIAVVDDRGTVIASADPARLLQRIERPAELTDRIRAHRALVAEHEWVAFEAGGAPERALVLMAPLQFASWGVVIEQPHADAFAGLTVTSRGLLLSSLGLGLMGVLVARTLSRSVLTPIRHLSDQATAMRSGDLSTPITAAGDFEIETLARTLDDARDRLRATLDELQAFNMRLEEQVAARTRVIVQQDEQRRTLVRRLLAATEDERRRIARELHDEIAQLLTVIQLSLHRIGGDSPEMARASALLAKTQQDVHRIIHDLRPSLLDDLGLPAALASYAREHLERHGLRVHLDIDSGLPARPDIGTVIYRIYQELVTNILRHAKAEQVSIELFERDGRLVLIVEDDGAGFDPEAHAGSAGLTGMRERASLVGGSIRLDSEAGAGTVATVEIPLQ